MLRRRGYLERTIDPETGEPYLQPVSVRLHRDSGGDAITMPPFFRDAYRLAESFCQLLAQRTRAAGYFRTLLLRRFGSTMEAGRRTVLRLLRDWYQIDEAEADDDGLAELGTLSGEERQTLERLLSALDRNAETDPKFAVLSNVLNDQGWLEYGCIVFTQYFDSADWLLEQLGSALPNEPIGLYGGPDRSQIAFQGERRGCGREEIKRRIK